MCGVTGGSERRFLQLFFSNSTAGDALIQQALRSCTCCSRRREATFRHAPLRLFSCSPSVISATACYPPVMECVCPSCRCLTLRKAFPCFTVCKEGWLNLPKQTALVSASRREVLTQSAKRRLHTTCICVQETNWDQIARFMSQTNCGSQWTLFAAGLKY